MLPSSSRPASEHRLFLQWRFSQQYYCCRQNVYALLTLFFKQFPEYAHQDFHIAGESYAGHYIPVFTSEIMSHKKTNINLKSVLIGNGLTDGYTQYEYYRPMACGDGGWPAVVDKSQCEAMDNAFPAANLSLKAATAARVSGHVFPLPSTAITLSSAPTNALGKTPTMSVFNAKMEVRYAILSLDGSANGSISLR